MLDKLALSISQGNKVDQSFVNFSHIFNLNALSPFFNSINELDKFVLDNKVLLISAQYVDDYARHFISSSLI